jgi:Coenzyme PQQ synthesis protein D (PqqD)
VRLKREGLIWRRAGGEVIALDLDRSQYLAANETAAAVWEALASGATCQELVATLCSRFDVEREVAQADVDRLLDAMRSEGLIEPGESAG